MATTTKFKECDAFVSKWEGGNVDHPKDPGGRTSRGVTQNTYNAYRKRQGLAGRDVYTMTEPEREEIYYSQFFTKVMGDQLPDGFDIVVYDPAVNSGPARGVKWFQEALRSELKAPLTADGGMGPKTVSFASSPFAVENGDAVIKKACANRFGFLRSLRTWGTFGKGWSRRVVDLEAFAVARWAAARGNARQVLAAEAATAQAEAKSGSRTAVGAGGAGGGAGAADVLPLELAIPLGIALLVVVAYLILRSRHDGQRAKAYEKELKNAK